MNYRSFTFLALACIAVVALSAESLAGEKVFAPVPGGQVRELAPRKGACFASDRITVQGMKVRFMYREAPDFKQDSGWRFFEGSESEEYTSNPDNFGIYDVNTVANYDPDIVPLLDAPVGSAFERSEDGKFVAVEFEPPQ